MPFALSDGPLPSLWVTQGLSEARGQRTGSQRRQTRSDEMRLQGEAGWSRAVWAASEGAEVWGGGGGGWGVEQGMLDVWSGCGLDLLHYFSNNASRHWGSL